ncbi:MAG: class II glutamine amidotransferase, partial [Nanoarchaeota archaeon]
MCGILGYIGNENAVPILINGLKKLEYRGYDSAGIAIINGNSAIIEKDIGKVEDVEKKIDLNSMNGTIGLAHCRWATHGSVTKENAHPHFDCKNEIIVVHNGIIENYQQIKEMLIKKGHKFTSETDTEVIPHLIEEHYQGDIVGAVKSALKEITGSYALGIITKNEPDKI